MKKLMVLFITTSVFVSSLFIIGNKNDQKVLQTSVIRQESLIETNIKEKSSPIIFTPQGKVMIKYQDGFSFNLDDELNVIKGKLHFINKAQNTPIKNAIIKNHSVNESESAVTDTENQNQTKPSVTAKNTIPAVKNTKAETKPAVKPTPVKVNPAPAPTPAPAPVPAPAPAPVQTEKSYIHLTQVEKDILTVTNRHRRENGLKDLVWDNTLYSSAKSHSALMFTTNNFAHTTKYSVAENIYMLASGDTSKYTAEFIVQKWMDSPGHRANILDSRITRIGAGVVKGNQYFEKYQRELPTIYATQHFK